MSRTVHRIVVEIPVEDGRGVGETDVRYAVERLVGGNKLHLAINRFAGIPPVPTGRVQVKMWSKFAPWLRKSDLP